MLPVYARDILQVGPEGLGPLRAAPAVGATLTAIFFSIRPLKTDVGVKMLTAVVIFGAATAIFGFSTSFWLSLAARTILGAADMFSVYIRQSLLQLHTPPKVAPRKCSVHDRHIRVERTGETRSARGRPDWASCGDVAGGSRRSATLRLGRLFPNAQARTFELPVYTAEEGTSCRRVTRVTCAGSISYDRHRD